MCTLGNGYFATCGAAAGAVGDDIYYPGTYLAGGYNRLRTDIAGRIVENEDLVNFPNWLSLGFRIASRYRAHSLDLRLTHNSLTIRGRKGAASPISLCVDGKIFEFASGTTRVFRLHDEVMDADP